GRSNADAGFLGARHSLVHIPQVHDERTRNLENARVSANPQVSERRAALLERLEQRFHQEQHGAQIVTDHRETYAAALRLMRTDKLRAFDVGHESTQIRNLYGPSQ